MRFSLHGLLTLEAPDPSPRLAGFLEATFAHELRGEPAGPPDLLIRRAEAAELALLAGRVHAGADDFELLDDQPEPAAVFFFRGRGDLLLRLGSPIELVYRAGSLPFPSRGASHLVWALRQALARRGGLVCHGAALAREQRTLAVFGPPMARKTTVVLGLLHRGWHLVADDRFILAEGQAHALDDTVALRHGHVESFPHLEAEFPTRARLRRPLLDLARRRLPSYLLPLVERFLPKEWQQVRAGRVLAGARTCPLGRVTHGLILARRPGERVEALAPETFVRQATPIQAMYPSRLARFSGTLAATWPELAPDYPALLTANLQDARLLRADAPLAMPVERLLEAITAAL